MGVRNMIELGAFTPNVMTEGSGIGPSIGAYFLRGIGSGRCGIEDEPPVGLYLDGVVIDEASYSAKVHGRTLDLTYKEFELLRFLAAHPSRVFTREQLLSEVWGYDYFGGTRTVDVHVRRLRAKLGDLDSLIGTVRNVGYRFVLPKDPKEAPVAAPAPAPVPSPAG